jgi:hypothetical protein
VSAAIVLATATAGSQGARGAAAALACAASRAGRAALLIELGDGRALRPALVASASARELEERLAAHVPDAAVAARGAICALLLPPAEESLARLSSALLLARDSAAVVSLPASLLQPALAERRIGASGVLLRADLPRDRPLVALAVRDLLGRRLRIGVLKRPLSWLVERKALFGVLPPGTAGGLPPRLVARLLPQPGDGL